MKKTKTEKKTTLTFWERITIQMSFPQESSFEGKIAINDLRKKLLFTQEDVKKYGIETDKEQAVKWSPAAAKKTFDYVFTDLEQLQIKLALSGVLTALDKTKQVSDQWLQLASKFDAKPFPKKKDEVK